MNWSGRIFFDTSGLIKWYAHHPNVSGIQRFAECIFTSPAVLENPRCLFVARAWGMRGFVTVPRDPVANLGSVLRRASAITTLGKIYRQLRGRAMRDRTARVLTALADRGGIGISTRTRQSRPELEEAIVGDTIISLADFWCHGDQTEAYASARAHHGLRVMQMIHDIMPITHPEYWPDGHGTEFSAHLVHLANHCDAFFANSRHVSGELASYLQACSLKLRPIFVLPFGWDFAGSAASTGVTSDESILAARGLEKNRYLLQVGTIEPRKNHSFVVRALRRLASRGLPVPVTVFVGKRGWKYAPLLAELHDCSFLDGRIRLLDDVSDAELGCLYRHCRFSIFPSHREGWGLPVQECLALGRPCLASLAPAIPEAGLDLAEYFDPRNLDTFTQLLAHWIGDDVLVAERAARIRSALSARQLPRWNDTSSAVLEAVETLQLALGRGHASAQLVES